MKPPYADPSRRLEFALEQLVSERLHPDELIYQWTAAGSDGCTAICLIEDCVYYTSREVSRAMGGLRAGGGRTLVFRSGADGWKFVEESEWVS